LFPVVTNRSQCLNCLFGWVSDKPVSRSDHVSDMATNQPNRFVNATASGAIYLARGCFGRLSNVKLQ